MNEHSTCRINVLARRRRSLLFFALILATCSLHGEELPNGDFDNASHGWALSTGAEVIEAPSSADDSLQGGVLSLPPGAFANNYLDVVPQSNTAYTFTVTTAPIQPELPTSGTITIYLYRGSETQNAAVAPIVRASGNAPQMVRVVYECNEAPEEGWQLGVQILCHEGGILADSARLESQAVAARIQLEGKFGKIEIDPMRPALKSLTLRRADGTLEPHSLLSPKGAPWQRGVPDWGTQALTFAVDETGRRFESRTRATESVEKTEDGIILRGVVLSDGEGEPVAKEDWTLEATGDDLVWTVERTWLRDLTTTTTGTPALFFSIRPINNNPSTILPNSVATTFWIAPKKLRGWHNPFYRPAAWVPEMKLALANNMVVTEPGGWAVLKLFPVWENHTEPRFSAESGHLYRRGQFGWLSEAGLVSHADETKVYKAGQTEKTTLRISAAPAAASGHQLAVKADDPSGTVDTLKRFYGALFNGGCINDQVNYNFGNETDGWYYGGASWMKGLPFLAGTPASAPSSSRPLELPHAFRDNLQMILGTEFEPGRTRFGYNTQGAYTDDNIIQVIGGRAYYLYSGDLAFVRQNLPFYRRAVAWYLDQRNADGLVALPGVSHWYYDAMYATGVTTYHNAFLYRALMDLAGLESAAGNSEKAAVYQEEAANLKDAINRVLWWEEAPGGPRYVDWILPDGTKIAYGADLCLFPPVAFGIASPEQGRKLIATIDARIKELERDNGYAGYASRSAYWPAPPVVNTHPVNQGFGNYMNGGSFLCMTYWEIMARAAAGDAEGAWNRLQKFAEGTRLTGEMGFVGNNWVTEDGRIGFGASDEPYLADVIAVPGALIQGILGIQQTNDKLLVRPQLPSSLQNVSAEVVHLGIRKRVSIDGKDVKIEDLGRAFTPPDELTWQVNAGTPPENDLYIDRNFDTGTAWSATPEIQIRRGEGIGMKRVPSTPLAGLWKLDDAVVGAVADASEYEAPGQAAANVVFQAPDRHGKPAAARFAGDAQIVVGNVEPFTFPSDQSFTIQAWLLTSSQENQVIAARSGAYSLGVKNGKLSAWIMQDGNAVVEAVGEADAADGKWHHVAAIFDREAQTLSLFLDGQPDGIPGNIGAIGDSTSASPLTIGAFGGPYPFNGTLDEISIHRAVLASADFSFSSDYAPILPSKLGAQTGTYTTAPCDWGQTVQVTALRTSASLNDGTITAKVETSNDGFKTVAETREIPVKPGDQNTPIDGFQPTSHARVVITLATPESAESSPVLSSAELVGISSAESINP